MLGLRRRRTEHDSPGENGPMSVFEECRRCIVELSDVGEIRRHGMHPIIERFGNAEISRKVNAELIPNQPNALEEIPDAGAVAGSLHHHAADAVGVELPAHWDGVIEQLVNPSRIATMSR